MYRSSILRAQAICPRSINQLDIKQPSKSVTENTGIKSFDEIPGPSSNTFRNLFKSKESSIPSFASELHELYRTYGPVVKENLGFGRGYVVHVFDPEDSQTVFRTEGKQPHIVPLQESTQKYRQMRGMNPGLGNLNGDEWYRLRSAAQQTLMRPQALDKYVPLVEQVSQRLVDHIRESLDKNNEVDMRKISGRWSLESAGLIVFERRLGALLENIKWADNLIEINHQIFKLSAELKFALPLFRYFTTPKWKKMVELEDKFYDEADLLMNRAIEELDDDNTDTVENKKKMLIGELINHKDLSHRDVKVIMLSLFSDGLSTTAPMLIYNLFNIAKSPEAQEKIRKEVKEAVKNGEELTAASRNRLPYLRACIKETFRLFPIGTEISRIPQKDIVLGGYSIPAGTPVDINTNILMRSPEIFSNPDEFVPDRWLRENKDFNCVHPFAFLPFGFGPRMCAGRRFAEQDLQIVLSRLVQNFEIGHDGEEISQIYETLLLPTGNCNFKFINI